MNNHLFQLDSLKSTDSARSDEIVSNDSPEKINIPVIDNPKQDITVTNTNSDSNSVKIIVNSNEMISENSADKLHSSSGGGSGKPEKSVTIVEDTTTTVATKTKLHNVVKIKINSESFDSDNDRRMEGADEIEPISGKIINDLIV